MSLVGVLPAPKNQSAPEVVFSQPKEPKTKPAVAIPPYGQRIGWVPRNNEDFGDGGAFPEIHVAQYPLDMGRKKKSAPSTAVVPVSLDSSGKVRYDALVTQGQEGKAVFSKYTDLVPKHMEETELARPDEEKVAETTEKTRAALERIINGKILATRPAAVSGDNGQAPTYIRYTSANQNPAFNSGSQNRLIKLVEMPKDPMEPPKFKHKKVPRGPPSPPVPVMHSPPRKLSVKDQQEWKIPPCISNWKNNKGYTIPLDKRLAADGRGLQDVAINDNFAKLSESLYIAERNAREEVAKRASIQKKLAVKEKEKKEELLRRLAQEAREQRHAGPESQHLAEEQPSEEQEEDNEDDDEARAKKAERDRIREERRRERERERRLAAKKSKLARDDDRDVSEKIALGQVAPPPSQEALYDQRLFNQSQGLDSGFGAEDSYNIYNKPLFSGSSANILYRPKKNDSDAYGGEEDVEKILKTGKFKPDKEFEGVDRSKPADPRSRPVEFQKEEDPFGLDAFLNEAKSGKKPLDKIGKSGHMHVGAAGEVKSKDSYQSSKRGNVEFDRRK